jgi:hypothetical protein
MPRKTLEIADESHVVLEQYVAVIGLDEPHHLDEMRMVVKGRKFAWPPTGTNRLPVIEACVRLVRHSRILQRRPGIGNMPACRPFGTSRPLSPC